MKSRKREWPKTAERMKGKHKRERKEDEDPDRVRNEGKKRRSDEGNFVPIKV